jgi:hypothetical protein
MPLTGPTLPRDYSSRMRISLRAVPVVVASVLLVAGCSATETPPGERAAAPNGQAPAAGPRYHFTRAADLESTIDAQVLKDKTAETTTTVTGTGTDGAAVPMPPGDGAVKFSEDEVSAHAFQLITEEGKAPAVLEAIVLPDTAYVKPPASMGITTPEGKPWVGPIQLGETSRGSRDQKLAMQAARAANTADPTRAFSTTLYGDSAMISSAVDEDLDGVPTVKYTIQVDIARAAAKQSDARRKRTLQAYLDQGQETAEVTLWVNAENRPLRSSVRAGEAERAGTVDIVYRNWGQPVQIAAPPAAESSR